MLGTVLSTLLVLIHLILTITLVIPIWYIIHTTSEQLEPVPLWKGESMSYAMFYFSIKSKMLILSSFSSIEAIFHQCKGFQILILNMFK